MSQLETLARHAAEKRARVARNKAAAKKRDEAQRRANGARAVNAASGSRARAIVEKRRADRAEKKADFAEGKKRIQTERKAAALERQRKHDREARDFKAWKEKKEEAEVEKKVEVMQAGAVPLVAQETREKGKLKGSKFGHRNSENFEMKRAIVTGVFLDIHESCQLVRDAAELLEMEPSGTALDFATQLNLDGTTDLLKALGALETFVNDAFGAAFIPFRERLEQ